MDYGKLLERYLQQHGQLLAEEFWVHLPDDELQVGEVALSFECVDRQHSFGLACICWAEHVRSMCAQGWEDPR